MVVHLKKLCVGVSTIEELQASIDTRANTAHALTGEPFMFITTKNRPKRDADILLKGGSLYWVISRRLCCRQQILAFRPGTRADGSSCIHIDLDHRLRLTRPRPHRPFQGWRYLEAKDAPEDYSREGSSSDDAFPPALEKELAKLGLM